MVLIPSVALGPDRDPPFLRVGDRHITQTLLLAEVVDQLRLAAIVGQKRTRLHIAAFLDVFVNPSG
ncbi:hypothetical protein N9N28_05030 [Rubripirellula amarantea]|nr:hypothetical protein [Rubripirellula amarantea]